MGSDAELAAARTAFAKEILGRARIANPALEAAFAAVRREDFLGPGPWQAVDFAQGYRSTPSADPVHLYTNELFGIVPERGLNNGQPSLHAFLLDQAAPQPGEHVVHVGAGVGYYTALMAQLVGVTGRVTGIEFDPALAARARANFAAWPNVEILCGDGAAVPFAPADVIYVNAGATKPARAWLDGLKDGGRLILPLTVARTEGLPAALGKAAHVGAVFRIVRRGDDYAAKWISPVAIFPCAGNRDDASAQALAEAFAQVAGRNVTRLLRRDHVRDERCWLHGDGWCLAEG
ncbi:MAG TPA: methyltransferase domain-containing protein [Rhizomicrobium sp.]|jgi:protein-L-isoaspartate(D-aspartate) O-methyltransferase|nr:methyltransferase domain-containing protein [Rhizomicrobium sp.]